MNNDHDFGEKVRPTEGPLHVLVLYGTRPEAIKMAPVIAALRRRPDRFRVTVCNTGQHREMVDDVQELFGLAADFDLASMSPGQGLNQLGARILFGLDRVLADVTPQWVLVQGDTTSAMAAALAAFHRRIPVGHVEAGLRTFDLQRPFPEEANRRIIDTLAELLFVPTDAAQRQLLAEGVASTRVHLTGNTVVDALQAIAARIPAEPAVEEVLVTIHRRENFGAPLRGIFRALRRLAESFPAVYWIYLVHPNPAVGRPAVKLLAGLDNLLLTAPLGYLEFVRRLRRCRFVLTDSGGIQEEAPTFAKPVLVLRDRTERPEGIDAGVAKLVGTSEEAIYREARVLLVDAEARRRMSLPVSPYGDGHAAERIASALTGECYPPLEPV